jgi:hypothetical protein
MTSTGHVLEAGIPLQTWGTACCVSLGLLVLAVWLFKWWRR